MQSPQIDHECLIMVNATEALNRRDEIVEGIGDEQESCRKLGEVGFRIACTSNQCWTIQDTGVCSPLYILTLLSAGKSDAVLAPYKSRSIRIPFFKQ